MIEYSLSLCYGIIVPVDKMREIEQALTDEGYDEMENYSSCINNWVGDNYFIGIMTNLLGHEVDLVCRVSEFTIPSDDDEDLIKFKCFFSEHDLWKLIDWKPELLLINFCY